MESQEQLNKSRVLKVDSEESWDFFLNQANNRACPGVASKMEIKAMPTFVFLKDGIQVDKFVGANPDEMKKRVLGFAQHLRSDQYS